MFEAWGRLMYRRRWPVLAAAFAALVFAAVWGTGVFGALTSTGGFTVPGSGSQKAVEIAQRDLGRSDADVVLVYRSPSGAGVDDPAFKAAVTGSLGALPKDRVPATTSYWSTSSPQFVSRDHKATYAVLQLAGQDDAARLKSYDAIKGSLHAPGLSTQIGGGVPTGETINDRVTADIGKADAISFPVLTVLLIVILGGVVAASLPLAIGGVAILGAFTALRLLTYGTDVSIFAINIAIFMGLGLAIDYGLIMVNRFREELDRTGDIEQAVGRTLATAGRTVAISGVTVAVSLAGLLLFPMLFLRSMGFGGIAVVLVDMVAALTMLPALLAVLGPRVNKWSIRRRRVPAEGQGTWFRLAHSVMRRPVAYVVGTVVLLLALGVPFLHITWGGVDAKVLPVNAGPRVAAEALDRDFTRNATSPIQVVVTGRSGDLTSYVERLGQVPGITGAAVTGSHGPTTQVSLRYQGEALSVQARQTVDRVRAVPPPAGTTAYTGGQTAEMADQLNSLGSTLPWLALVVGAATFVLLFLAFGSVVLPFKAMAMNALSLSAMFGAMVWIFQDGHLSGLLDFTATGSIAPAMPILMLAMVFGLSMDYEVFLLSRVRERYDVTGDNTTAVAEGLQRTGGVITSAALLLIVVIGAFSTSGITFIKMTGVGMVIAIAVDATIVRALLVPATMRLLGRANWWAPGPLGRLYSRFGIREEDTQVPEPVPATR
ncbi:MAG TPA: MMPL family transporter [Streptosporangiaceae bacterium]|nr:MMPL family transporter [Streptosporangiaceae bacterium]